MSVVNESELRFLNDMHTIVDAKKTPCAQERNEKLDSYCEKPFIVPWWKKAFVIWNWSMATIVGFQVLNGYFDAPIKAVSTLLLLPIVLFSADFIAAAFHKWIDSYASEANPIWGQTVRYFRQHHEFPDNLNDEPMMALLAPFAIGFSPLFSILPFVSLEPQAAASAWVMLMSLMHTQEFHRQAHRKNPNAFFKLLQTARLSLSHQHHLQHHRPSFSTDYSVYNGWSDALTQKTRIWERLDRIFWRLLKKLPHNWVQDPRSIPDGVVEELISDIKKIPPQLWGIALAYPSRIPEPLQEPIKQSRDFFRETYIAQRVEFYQKRLRKGDRSAELAWKEEQEHYPWLFGETPKALPPLNQ